MQRPTVMAIGIPRASRSAQSRSIAEINSLPAATAS